MENLLENLLVYVGNAVRFKVRFKEVKKAKCTKTCMVNKEIKHNYYIGHLERKAFCGIACHQPNQIIINY